MAAPRLPLLWPYLYRGVEASHPALRPFRATTQIRRFHPSTHRRRPDAVQQRYGTANQPPPHLGDGKGTGPATKQQTEEQPKALPKIGEKLQGDGEAEIKAEQAEKEQNPGENAKAPTTVDGKVTNAAQIDPMLDASEAQAVAEPPGPTNKPDERPMETLLNTVPDPANPGKDQQSSSKSALEEHPDVSFDEHAPPVKAPHINTPRYVHHFDTYGLVRRLVDSGWSEDHAITQMKAVRLMLADNMDLATEALVSKSQVENETYLFRAACAELKTEVVARRKGEQEKMRAERSQLQHELDILSQRVGQESGALKDELKGMFDDRKMAVRNEQRIMESKIQRLGYQITVDLQADAKSDVEALRWVMTRRVIIALGAVIIMILGSLKLYSNALHEQEMEAKRKESMKSSSTQTTGFSEGEAISREGRGLAGGEMLVKDGDNPAFVSLG